MNDDDDYAFATQHSTHSNAIYKWIMDLKTTKHITSQMTIFDIYKVIAQRNVHLHEDSVVEAIEVGSIIVEILVRGKI